MTKQDGVTVTAKAVTFQNWVQAAQLKSCPDTKLCGNEFFRSL
jgi:hypothetical protein